VAAPRRGLLHDDEDAEGVAPSNERGVGAHRRGWLMVRQINGGAPATRRSTAAGGDALQLEGDTGV
jgi:hypothetical protein